MMLSGTAAMAAVPTAAVSATERLQLAFGFPPAASYQVIDTQGRVLENQPLSATTKTTLGSVWKLFAYDYLVKENLPEQPYVCHGSNREEIYCCDPGHSVTRDEALVKSCGLYFEPERWKITPVLWEKHWPDAPAWLRQLSQLKPETEVSVSELLQVLAILSTREQASNVLLDRVLLESPLQSVQETGSSAPLAATLGSRLRIKTWSWHRHADRSDVAAGDRIGGFAGWTSAGIPIWASGEGTSQQVLQHFAGALDGNLPSGPLSDTGPCVDVALFDRYPLVRLEDDKGRKVTTSGPLTGRFVAFFSNGNKIDIESQGELILMQSAGELEPRNSAVIPDNERNQRQSTALVARLSREEYVARVIDREASATPVEAAKAFAVVARTFLLQNAERQGACLQIHDSSHQQRVAPRAASDAARSVAGWSAGLVLAGAPVNYHQTESGAGKLGWERARDQAAQGWRYDAILAAAFPRSNLARWDNPRISCQALPDAEQWLAHQLPRWRERLEPQPGYMETHDFSVCRLQTGKPHVDRARHQIFVRHLQSQQDRLDLAHEYLHLAFDAHPNGQDEAFVETWARRLILE